MSKISCPICSKEYHFLLNHVRMAHKISSKEFKERYPGHPTVSSKVREQRRVAANTLHSDKEASRKRAKSISETKKKTFTKEDSRRLAESRKRKREADPEHREYISNQMSKAAKKLWTDHRDKMVQIAEDLWDDESYRDKQLRTRGKKVHKFESSSGDVIWMRSSWEVRTAEFLEAEGVKFDYETLRFPYEFEGKRNPQYTPDFYLVDKGIFLEVKPKTYTKALVNQEKLKAVRSAGYLIRYVTEDDLKDKFKSLSEFIKSNTKSCDIV
ncbi:putative endonuclease [Bacillus phage SP-15]|uniref:Putative endonuclease n=1 Tax=Bacillus phage SP-15 TaxID=1792032 RepID=A0A127AVZ8_9CAUD|nr:putative endonuclease [Bacillus phage SP-15]AMM44832.1 putative endonuclease [Bacillus phage SP-15]